MVWYVCLWYSAMLNAKSLVGKPKPFSLWAIRLPPCMVAVRLDMECTPWAGPTHTKVDLLVCVDEFY